MTRRARAAALGALFATACSSWAPADERLDAEAGFDAGASDGGGGRDAAFDAGVDAGFDGGDTCPDDPPTVLVSSDIETDTTWTCLHRYLLVGEVHVTFGATLTVRRGTRIEAGSRAVLVFAAGSRLEAIGTAEEPVVFTSQQDPPDDGDWAGIVMLGNAGVQTASRVFDEIARPELYGGDDDAHRCGSLTYTRIEFAGARTDPSRPHLPALLLAGCGSDTTLDHVQIHMSDDDGIAFWGGSASGHHIVITKADDNAVEWQWGYDGTLQFVVVQQTDGSESGLKGENSGGSPDRAPRSEPWLSNLTLIGRTDEPTTFNSRANTGILLTDGTAGHITNVIVLSYDLTGGGPVDVVGVETAAQATAGDLTVEHMIVFDTDSLGDGTDDDGLFPEETHFTMSGFENRFDVDPMIDGDPYSWLTPTFTSSAGTPPSMMADTPDSSHGLDPSATYVGAIEPGGTDWTLGWTNYARP